MAEFIDKTGEPRSDKEIIEAAVAIKYELIKGQPSSVMVFYPTIIDALEELIKRRSS